MIAAFDQSCGVFPFVQQVSGCRRPIMAIRRRHARVPVAARKRVLNLILRSRIDSTTRAVLPPIRRLAHTLEDVVPPAVEEGALVIGESASWVHDAQFDRLHQSMMKTRSGDRKMSQALHSQGIPMNVNSAEFEEAVTANQGRLRANLRMRRPGPYAGPSLA